MGSQVLLAYKDLIFEIEGNGGVIQCNEYSILGSGEANSIGYMNMVKSEDKKQMVIDAIKSSCKSNLYVNLPIVVMNTEDDSVEIITE
jgi:ATP-dependent protease HslVU (ClpYQ) peptidase subunit